MKNEHGWFEWGLLTKRGRRKKKHDPSANRHRGLPRGWVIRIARNGKLRVSIGDPAWHANRRARGTRRMLDPCSE